MSGLVLLVALTILAASCQAGSRIPQNMTILSSNGVLLSVQYTNCTLEDICENESNSWAKDMSLLFTPWSDWSKCTTTNNGQVVKTREKRCKYSDICADTTLKEEKLCHKRKRKRKRNKWRKTKIKNKKKKTNTRNSELLFHVVTIPTPLAIKHLGTNISPGPGKSGNEKRIYSKWSRWTMCSRSCLTQRYRWCKKVDVCGNDVIRQTAYCYTEGSHCEIWIQTKFAEENPDHGISERPQTGSNSQSHGINRVEPSASVTESPSHPPPQELVGTSETRPVCGVAMNSSYLPHPGTSNMLRIIGGRPTQIGKWPWIVAVLNRLKEAFCGGTLVSSRWVLTAAHCVRRRLYVTIGEYDLNQKDEKELRLRVKKSIIHPKYNVETVDNDVALLYLPMDVPYHAHSGVACLPKSKDPLPMKQLCTIVGWGKRSASDSYGTDILHEAQVPVVTKTACREVYNEYQITGNMFCAGYRRGRMDSCSGDSGGPLLCKDLYGRWTVFGITSFGEGCGKRGKYGIYTKLPNYVRWIRKVIHDGGV